MSSSRPRSRPAIVAAFGRLLTIRWHTVNLPAALRSSGKYLISLYFSVLYLMRHRADGGVCRAWAEGFDIVTVVFDAELDLLRLQARSFDRYLGDDFAGEIVILVNDLRPGKITRRIRSEVLPAYGRWRDRVRILPFHALAYRLDPANGWIIQQVLKLAYARLCARPWYVVFDAKNHLIAPVSIRTFFDSRGDALQPFRQGSVGLPAHEAACAAYFGLEPGLEARPQFRPMTPFVLHTATVERLVQHVEAREGVRLADFFCDRRLMSEFLLYGVYVHAFAGGLDKRYRDVEPRVVTLWCESGPLAAALDLAREADIVCFGVHRHYIAMLSADDRAKLESFWRSRGLLGKDETLIGRFGPCSSALELPPARADVA